MGVVCVVILRLRLGRRNIAQRCQQALVIEPGDPFQRRHFNVLEAPPRSVPMDHFGREQSEHGFGKRVDAPMCQDMVLARYAASGSGASV